MNLIRITVLVLWFGGLVAMGCASLPPFPESSLTGRIVEVKIGEPTTSHEITAKPGDEIRWINTTGRPVDISFVEPLSGRVSCQKGFVSTGWGYLFGGESTQPDILVVATVHDHESVSLCFSAPGTYAYTMRRETTETGKAGGIAGVVTIE